MVCNVVAESLCDLKDITVCLKLREIRLIDFKALVFYLYMPLSFTTPNYLAIRKLHLLSKKHTQTHLENLLS